MAEVAVGNVDGVLAEVRVLAQALIAPAAAEIDRESRFPDQQLSALAQVGALGLMVPCEHGGVGQPALLPLQFHGAGLPGP
jgi:alkylation response protein AidB-like acyl-CoA dehydrogenase